jgi:hypothetical protein
VDDNRVDWKTTGDSRGDGYRRVLMTFCEDKGERRGRGRIELRGRRTRALSYGECLCETIRVGVNFLLLINNGGTSFILWGFKRWVGQT